MAPPSRQQGHPAAVLSIAFLPFLLLFAPPSATAIGVNYGTKGDNLPPPSKVATFLSTRTLIDRVKLFDANPEILLAFANTGISVVVTAANGDIPTLATKPGGAAAWVTTNISPYHPSTNISLVNVGNEILLSGDKSLISNLVPAMRALKSALVAAGYPTIRVSTPHALGVLADVSGGAPPSAGRFVAGLDKAVFAPMLEFHRQTTSPFVVNPYPYFGYNGDTVGYALARRDKSTNPGVLDPGTGIVYTSMLEAQLDSVYSAMKRLGFGDVEIAVGETGWPSKAEVGQAGVGAAEAAEYNRYLVGEISGGSGTPLMPKRRFETYIFALFNENLKPGPVAERNFGLFEHDLTPVYDVGLMKDGAKTAAAPAPAATVTPGEEAAGAPEPVASKKHEDEAAAAPAETTASSAPAPAGSGEDDASPDATSGPAPSEAPAAEGGSTGGDGKTPEEEGGDAPAGAAGGESSETAKAGDEEGSTEEKKPEATPAPAGAASAAADLLVPVSSMLAAALSLVLHM